MNILILHSSSIKDLPSGEFFVANNQNIQLNKLGFNSIFINYKPFYFNYCKNNFLRLIITLIFNIWSPFSYLYVRKLILSHKPDIIHFHGLFPFLTTSAITAASHLGVPIVQTLHNVRWLCLEGGFYRANSYCDKCVKRGYFYGVIMGCKHGNLTSFMLYLSRFASSIFNDVTNRVDSYIAVSNFIRKQHLLGGFPSSKIIVINNSISTSYFNSLTKVIKRNSITYIGRISKKKDLLHLNL